MRKILKMTIVMTLSAILILSYTIMLKYAKYNADMSVLETVNDVADTIQEATIKEITEPETETTIESTTVKAVNENELYLLAHLMYAEYSDGTNEQMQLYIGSVVLNRMKHGSYPDTMYEVIYQRGQYACTWDGNFEKEPDAETWSNAEKLLQSGSVLPDNVVYQAEFIQGDVYAHIGNTYFCYY